jgi:hypothetical protein
MNAKVDTERAYLHVGEQQRVVNVHRCLFDFGGCLAQRFTPLSQLTQAITLGAKPAV